MSNKRIYSQHAVFIPVAAVVALGVFSFLFLLVGYTGIVKVAQSELRAKADIACGAVGLELDFPTRVRVFNEHVAEHMSDSALRYSSIVDATLIMPTMPDNGNFGFSSASSSTVGPNDPYRSAGGRTPFSSLGMGLNCEKCGLYRSVKAEPSVSATQFPPNFWNNLRNAGNTIGCEFKAKVDTGIISPYFMSLLGGETLLSVKSVWWAPIRSPSPTSSATDPGVSTAPGLTIAIGTELFTSSFDERFRFKDVTEYDPVLKAMVGVPNPATEDFFDGQQPAVPFDTVKLSNSGDIRPFLSSIPSPAKNRIWSDTIPRKSANGRMPDDFSFIKFFPVPPAYVNFNYANIPSDRDAMWTACLNPLTLVRNAFVSTIVELASRHGQLRNMTEILHMNPVHRHRSFAPSTGVQNSNMPTQIVRFGEDLVAPNYQLPYVFYNTGGAPTGDGSSDYPVVAGDAQFAWFDDIGFSTFGKGGWINPFGPGNPADVPNSWIKNPDDKLREHHSAVAGQLRYCHNLYAGMPRYSSASQADLIPHPQFDPDAYRLHRDPNEDEKWRVLRRDPVKQIPGEPPQTWDQHCQFSALGNACNPNYSNVQGLTAGELVSILGSTQMCPANTNESSLFPANSFLQRKTGQQIHACPLTVSPTNAGFNLTNEFSYGDSLELAPDLVGTLRYITRASPEEHSKAIVSPGLFPIEKGKEGTSEPFLADKYAPTANIYSSILFVFHQPLGDDEDMRAQITSIVSKMLQNTESNKPTLIRPITIVYMPSTYEDHKKVQDLKTAFMAEVGDFSGDTGWVYFSADGKGYAQPIIIYNLSPYDSYWGPLCKGPGEVDDFYGSAEFTPPGGGSPFTLQQPEVFRRYWECLLSQNVTPSKNAVGIPGVSSVTNPGNIVLTAQRIFSERLLRRELKF